MRGLHQAQINSAIITTLQQADEAAHGWLKRKFPAILDPVPFRDGLKL